MKKSNLIIRILVILSIPVVMGCVEQFEANIGDVSTEGLVVEGDIISDSTMIFQLSRTLPLDADGNKDLFDTYLDVNAEVSVKGSDGTFWTGVSQGRGRYQVEIGTLRPDVEYYLEIHYKGDMYQSEPQKPLETRKIDDLSFKQPDLEGPVSILLDTEEGVEGQADYYLWYFEEDWEVHALYSTTALFDPEKDKIVVYDYPPVAQGWCYNGTSKIILGTTEKTKGNKIAGKVIQTIENTDNRISVLYSIRLTQRNLSRQEYEYYQVRSKLDYDMGGLFTPQPSELPTNITCSDPNRKVIGYVGCNMGVSQEQLYVSEEEVFYRNNYKCDTGTGPSGSYLDKYYAGYQICEYGDGILMWSTIKCVDVRRSGADPQGRPSWWPNPYLYHKESE